MSKKPRFFCDNCGSEVGQNEKSCRNCGRYFASVRCPSCGHIGDESSFQKGCPACGYSAPPGKPAEKKPAARYFVPAGKLPLWVYFFSIGAFIIACAMLIFKFR